MVTSGTCGLSQLWERPTLREEDSDSSLEASETLKLTQLPSLGSAGLSRTSPAFPTYPIREAQIPGSLSLFPEAAFLAFLLPKFQETLSFYCLPDLQVAFLFIVVLRASSILP